MGESVVATLLCRLDAEWRLFVDYFEDQCLVVVVD